MKLSSFAAAAALLIVASPSFAEAGDPVNPACQSSDISGYTGTYTGCVGYLSGNLLSGAFAAEALADSAINTLLGTTSVDYSQIALQNFSGSTIDFTTYTAAFGGNLVLGVHRGGGNNGEQGTAFYNLNLTADTQSLTYNLSGLSNAALYINNPGDIVTNPVPEPSTYALMFGGLGLLSFVARRRSRK